MKAAVYTMILPSLVNTIALLCSQILARCGDGCWWCACVVLCVHSHWLCQTSWCAWEWVCISKVVHGCGVGGGDSSVGDVHHLFADSRCVCILNIALL